MESERNRIIEHARHLLNRYLEPARFGASVPLEIAAHHLHGEPVSYAMALEGPWEPFEVGQRWGGNWDTTWLRLRGAIPAAWAGGEVDLRVDLGYHGSPGFGAEGLLWADGVPVGGVNSRHQEIVLSNAARGGETVEFYIEAAANPRGGGPDLLMPEYAGPARLVLERADIAMRRPLVDALCLDMRVLVELTDTLPADGRRSGEVLAALRAGCAAIDPRAVEDSAEQARKILAEPLARRAVSGAHRVSAVGHAHIDTAWLWPLRETVRKCARTFSTAVTLMDSYPEYRFACSQAQQHAWVKEFYPDLFARITKQVARGRFEPVGSMWVEPDCNLPSGESLVRQFLYGKRFFQEVYGIETRECWLPDAFGYPASLPQIMAKAGVDAFISQKMSWNAVNRFPHHSFRWEGIDGTRVLAHFPPADTYNGDFSVEQLRFSESNFADHQVSSISLYPFGYGDGGGGPTREMLERAERCKDLDGLPKVELQSVHDFLEALARDREDLATWVGELYLEFHRGTYTTHADVKAGNRRGEIALRDAELWSSGLAETRDDYPAADLASAWRTLLVHQFHDILPGSSINWVYRDTRQAHSEVLAAARTVSEKALAALATSVDAGWASSPVLLVNSCSHERHEVVPVPVSGEARSPALSAGPTSAPTSMQHAHDGSWLALVKVPSCGWATYDVVEADATKARLCEAAFEQVSAEGGVLENALLRVDLDASGMLRSVYDKVAKRQVLEAGALGNILTLHDDEPAQYDAWDIDEFSADRVERLDAFEDSQVIESGPLRAGIRLRRRFGSSRLSQIIWLHAGSARIDFETEVDWHERHRLLKVAFPVAVRATEASYEIQFGYVRRPNHTNTSWDAARFEVCAHRWADISETGYGVALLNDSKYGYDVRANVLRLSLLRSPTAPDPEADQGVQRFTYSLLPHQGGLADGHVVEEGLALNTPIHALAGTTQSSPHEPGGSGRASHGSLVSFDRPGVVLEAMKRSEDSAEIVVLRIYEAHGGRGPVQVRVGFPVASARSADLLERPGESLPVNREAQDSVVALYLEPFEISTVLLEVPAPR